MKNKNLQIEKAQEKHSVKLAKKGKARNPNGADKAHKVTHFGPKSRFYGMRIPTKEDARKSAERLMKAFPPTPNKHKK